MNLSRPPYFFIIVFLLMLTTGVLPVLGDLLDNSIALHKLSSADELEQYISNQSTVQNTRQTLNSTPFTPGSSLLTNGGSIKKDTAGIHNAEPQNAGGIQSFQRGFPNQMPENQVFSLEFASTSAPDTSIQNPASTYSTTNIQVKGVDEPDFVKNDGKYIYIIHKNSLKIIDAYPPEHATILSQTPMEGDVSDIFLNGDRLVVFTGKPGQGWIKPSGSVAPVPTSEYQTHALIYSISDHAHPLLLRDITIPGKYQNARMIGNDIYVLNQESRSSGDYHMPSLFEGKKEVSIRNIWAPPQPPANYAFYSLSSFNLLNEAQPKGESFLLGKDSTLYVSPDNVYIAYKNILTNPETKINGQESVVHRFSIKEGDISYKATGTFPGYLLNQFSLDEQGGNLRVATTRDQSGATNGRSNGVYVLDPDLTVIGSLDDLAAGEKIYSARFMGDLLYLVTFRTMDPLFVIDLSNPKKPGVLGELKIPGYSEYLHPYDDTHLIGIGKNTTENHGGVSATGIKIALFDVSNLTNPQEIDHIILGDKGSDSEILHDHHAFLLDKEKNVMAIPMKEQTNFPAAGTQYTGSQTPSIWQGTYVYGIDLAKGFIAKGRVTQHKIEPANSPNSGSVVRRSIMMDDILYTISEQNIIATNISDFSRQLADISLI
ncbi:beta-propeller domain-containing protein [Methanospirillum lacunae]|uniref:Copper amine oxidase n=1 Tax=Methanospirillum lacunae TaxID=668570 RepID=A0A2V2N1Q6_9EURY|nr:beta-propeller domain-containing protein [Methanospirillum lacunae]PWR71626.1 hypothetical protein DK846_12290 [Methanospirillum lacunae]